MRKATNIYDDKEYITSINAEYVFFRFPDGSQDQLLLKQQHTYLSMLYDWLVAELKFYERMYTEIKQMYKSEEEEFKKTRHYYSTEEMNKANIKNRFASITLELENKKYIEEWNNILGKADIASDAYNRYLKFSELSRDIKKVIDRKDG